MTEEVAKTPAEYLKEPYVRALVPNEDGVISAQILEFRGTNAFGNTPNEAYAMLEEIAEIWIEIELERGNKIPAPFFWSRKKGELPEEEKDGGTGG